MKTNRASNFIIYSKKEKKNHWKWIIKGVRVSSSIHIRFLLLLCIVYIFAVCTMKPHRHTRIFVKRRIIIEAWRIHIYIIPKKRCAFKSKKKKKILESPKISSLMQFYFSSGPYTYIPALKLTLRTSSFILYFSCIIIHTVYSFLVSVIIQGVYEVLWISTPFGRYYKQKADASRSACL